MNRLLIANRGEIAVRIIATARDLGIFCISVYPEDDALAQHVCLHGEGDGGGELGFEVLPCIVFVVVGREVHDDETAWAVYGCGMVRSREELYGERGRWHRGGRRGELFELI